MTNERTTQRVTVCLVANNLQSYAFVRWHCRYGMSREAQMQDFIHILGFVLSIFYLTVK